MKHEDSLDRIHQREIGDKLEELWGVECHMMGSFSHVDSWLEKPEGKLFAYAELKWRGDKPTTSPYFNGTVFMAMQKWLSLMWLKVTWGVPALYVVQFRDILKCIRVENVKGEIFIGGRDDRGRIGNDWEPIIKVPIADMTEVKPWDE
jgi:hypothetical protein